MPKPFYLADVAPCPDSFTFNPKTMVMHEVTTVYGLHFFNTEAERQSFIDNYEGSWSSKSGLTADLRKTVEGGDTAETAQLRIAFDELSS